MHIYDISLPIMNGMTSWPGDPPPKTEPDAQIARGDPYNVSRIQISSHTGTHVDAPRHFIPDASTVDQISTEILIGPAFVADLRHVPAAISAAHLDQLSLPAGVNRLLLRTQNSHRWTDPRHHFDVDFVHLAPDAAQWLVDRAVRLVGIDYLSIEGYRAVQHVVHRTLLAAGLVIVEGLNLSGVAPGFYQLVCLPLKIVAGDGAPARVVLIAE